MDALFRDIRHAVRSLLRTPGFTLAVLLILALGIGMSAAMFTVFQTVLVDRLPIDEQERVVIMHPLDRSGRNLDVPAAYLEDIARDNPLIRGVTGVYHLMWTQPFMSGSTPVPLATAATSTNYFDLLGTQPVVGRFFRPEDGQPGAPPVLVLSYAAWHRDFAGDPSVLGRSLTIPYTQQRATIIGVARPGFAYPRGADAWQAFPTAAPAGLQVDIIARLAPDATIDAARAKLFALTQRLNPFGSGMAISGVAAQSFADTVLGGSRRSIVVLTIAVALLLLIACVNIGNLSLVRLLGRSREIAVRRAIGASSLDIIRLFAVENALLALLGGALGWVVAMSALDFVRAAAPPQVPRIDALGSVTAPLAAAAGITLVVLVLVGILPNLVASRVQSYSVLRSDSRTGGESRSARRVRQWLVAVQIAVAVVMLNGAGLLIRTLARLESVDLGYRPDHLSVISFTGPQTALPSGEAAIEAGRQLVRRLEATPGIVAATPILSEPFQGQSLYIRKVSRIEQSMTERERNPFVPFEFVGPDYFRTFAIPIVRGRSFQATDTPTAERVAVVNETLARQLWPNAVPIGKRILPMPASDTSFMVVGVAGDTRFRELKNVGPVVYFEWGQMGYGLSGFVAVRTTRPLPAVLPEVRAASRDIAPALVVWKAETMDHLLGAPLAQPRLSALLLSGFSLVALLLSAVGLFGIMAVDVRAQRHDIGVRMALGAMPGTIRRLVVGQAFVLVGAGMIAGLGGALGTSRLMTALLFQVDAIDPMTLVAVCVMLLTVAALASYLPARRAARIDPIEALRAD